MTEVSKETGGQHKMQNSDISVYLQMEIILLQQHIQNLNAIQAHRQDSILFDLKLELVLAIGENQVNLSLFTSTE